MGGGKGGGCQLVGYGYTLTMLYAFCEKADKVSGWKVNDKIWWQDNTILTDDNTYQTYTQSLYTGKKGDIYHSDGSDHTDITFYLADYTPISYPQNNIGYDIKLNNTTFSYMENAFVGDNTTAVPRYTARLSRFFINGQNHRVGTGSINPIAVIREIMTDFLDITELDNTSFNEAYNTCSQEGLGVAFIMTTEKKVKNWLKEILRTIDGVLWFDTIIGKWKIKLFRPDYDSSAVFEISEDNTSKIEITSGSWDSLVNNFTFKYTDILTGKTNSFTIENSALFNILGYKVSKVYTYQLVGEYQIMAKIANRVIKKNSKPLAQLKARISIVDLPYIELGGVVKVTSTKLDIETQYFRITKIGGDKEDDVYVDIEAMEEIWDVEYDGTIVSEPPVGGNDTNFEIFPLTPYRVEIKELSDYFAPELKSNEQPILSVVTYPKNYEDNYVLDGVNKDYTYGSSRVTATSNKMFYYGLLGNSFPSGSDAVDDSLTLEVKPFSDSYCEFPTVTQTEEDWQKITWVMIIGNEFFSVKDISTIDSVNHIYQLKGIIRLMDKRDWHSYNAKTPIYLVKTPIYLVNTFDISSVIDLNITQNNVDLVLSAKYYNYATKSQETTTSKVITGVARKLLPPDYNYAYIDNSDSTLYLVFTKKARGVNTNAIISNIENITAGEKENTGEATHLIIDYNGTTKTVVLDTTLNSNVSVSNGLYTVNLTQEASNITLSNINKIKTQCVQQHYTLESDYINVIKQQ